MKMRSIALGAVLTSVLGISLAFAQANPIKERQAIMEANGKSMKTASDMAKGEKPYDAAAAGAAMKAIHDSVDKFVSLFPEGTEKGGETRAKAEIWKNKQDFTDWGKQLKEDATKAQAAAAGGLESFKTVVADMGKTCGGCHKDYREEKK
jgi:cytochrome c556